MDEQEEIRTEPEPELAPADAPEPFTRPPLEGKLLEVRYTGPFDEVEVRLPNGARARVKSGAYLKTTKDQAEALAASGVWTLKGGSK